MTPQEEHRLWRNRYIASNLVGVAGTALVFFAFLLWQSDRIVEGGSILGLPLALVGLVAALFGPRWAARRWRTPPEP